MCLRVTQIKNGSVSVMCQRLSVRAEDGSVACVYACHLGRGWLSGMRLRLSLKVQDGTVACVFVCHSRLRMTKWHVSASVTQDKIRDRIQARTTNSTKLARIPLTLLDINTSTRYSFFYPLCYLNAR